VRIVIINNSITFKTAKEKRRNDDILITAAHFSSILNKKQTVAFTIGNFSVFHFI